MTPDTVPALSGQASQLYALINSTVDPKQIDGAVKLEHDPFKPKHIRH